MIGRFGRHVLASEELGSSIPVMAGLAYLHVPLEGSASELGLNDLGGPSIFETLTGRAYHLRLVHCPRAS